MYLKTQKFLVAGISRSGLSAARLLISHGATAYVYDEMTSSTIEKNITQLKSLGAIVVTSERLKEAIEVCDVLVLSPGIPIDHSLPVAFKKAGKKIIGEMELGTLFLKATAVAVTGTNGKTTTVGLLKEILQRSGKKVIACGNVGRPLCDCVEELDYDDIAVIEVSSFQLESLSSLRAHVYVELNITEDHLNRHYNMENYIFLKGKLLKNGTESEFAVLNYDDQTVRDFSQKTKARAVWFSLREKVDGAYLYDGELFWKNEKIISVKELSTSGMHNVANTLAAISVAKLFGLENETIAQGIASFKGIRHRIEKVAEIDGVSYVNDSKATNVDATVKALEGMTGETVLLLGGKDKGYDYDALFEVIKRSSVVHVVLYGENRFKLLSAAVRANYRRATLCPELEMAVRFAAVLATPKQTVLLSPASASFDAFSGYEERGDCFTELVKAMEPKEKNYTQDSFVQAVEDVIEEREE
ncbi:MAG: UDP-N-acetylmuramoyl-L-alanine--D-glutamate ligase [Clostridia bacterium]|nr:UDP-N-acetylmuramoyl-L-alanine--D-glutamate ligase [Clostridia bacterium]